MLHSLRTLHRCATTGLLVSTARWVTHSLTNGECVGPQVREARASVPVVLELEVGAIGYSSEEIASLRQRAVAAVRSTPAPLLSLPRSLARSLSISARLPFPPFNAALCAILEQAEELRRYRRKHPTASALTQAEFDAFLQDAFIPSVRCMHAPAHARTHACTQTHCLDSHGWFGTKVRRVISCDSIGALSGSVDCAAHVRTHAQRHGSVHCRACFARAPMNRKRTSSGKCRACVIPCACCAVAASCLLRSRPTE